MGGEIGGVPEPPPLRAGPDPAQSIGRYLAQQRELRGIAREELAELTRIPLRSIERLESGAFDHDPDGFVRGFVRTVAQAIGLDPDETVTRMLAEPELSSGVPFPDWRGIALVLTGIVLFVGIATLGLRELGSPADEAASAPPPRPIRSDPVRELARERGLLPEATRPAPAPTAATPDE